MITIEKRMVGAMPVLTAKVRIDSDVTDADLAYFAQLWTAMYDEHPRFVLEVDITDVAMISGMAAFQKVVDILADHRERSRLQIPVTGLVVPLYQRPLLAAGLLLYEPITTLVHCSDLETLRDTIDAKIRTETLR